MESVLESLKQEKDHLEKIIKVVIAGGKFLRLPYQKKSRSISENLKLISQNLDKLSEQVQQTTNQHSWFQDETKKAPDGNQAHIKITNQIITQKGRNCHAGYK